MKTYFLSTSRIVYFLFVAATVLSCGGDGDSDPKPGESITVGTFAGNIQVSDDPTTEVGYIYNAKVTVKTKGTAATVTVVGDSGFDREYSAKVTTQSATSYDITLERQTKPTDKIAGDRVVILNDKLTIVIDVANDEVAAKPNPGATENIVISGKLQMIGTDMLRE